MPKRQFIVKRQIEFHSKRWGIYLNDKLIEGGFFNPQAARSAVKHSYLLDKDLCALQPPIKKNLTQIKRRKNHDDSK